MNAVLVVDDDPSVSHSFRHALSPYRVEVTAAYGVQHAVDLLNSLKFNAVILDLVLGHRSGFDVLDAMRAGAIETPVIVTSSRLPDYARMLLLPSQVLTIVKKPFDGDIVISAILGLCGIDPDELSGDVASERPLGLRPE